MTPPINAPGRDHAVAGASVDQRERALRAA